MKNVFMSDFETTTKSSDCRVWAWGVVNIFEQEAIDYGNSIDTFIDHLSTMANGSIIYFHNLKFDGQFIANKLLHLGYSWGMSKNDQIKPETFSFTISNQGIWYSGYVNLKNGNKIYFRDSLKKIPFKIKDIAVAFDLNILKGDLDYSTYRGHNHQLTEAEKAYFDNDLLIGAQALQIQYSEGMDGMTISGDCLKDLKATLSQPVYDNYFPVLSDELYYELKKGYRGGQTYVNKKFQDKVVGKGMVFDVNSQYPWAMYEKPMPHGMPIHFNGKYVPNTKYPLYIQHIKCEFKLKPDHIPTIQIKGDKRFKANEFLEHSYEYEQVDLYLTNMDLELFFNHYEVYNVNYIDGHMFKSKVGIFNNYIEKYMYQKQHSKGALRALAKLKLNSVYGKFGTDPDITGKRMFLNPDGSNGFRLINRVPQTTSEGKTIYVEDKELNEYGNTVYLPVAIFTTSYGRELIVTTAQKVYHRFCYCDTDSIHLIGTDTPVEIADRINSKKLGYWAHESTFDSAKFIRQKTYLENVYVKYVYDKDGNKVVDRFNNPITTEANEHDYEDIHLDVKCAGMPENIKKYVTMENFHVGATIKAPPTKFYGTIKERRVKRKFKLIKTERDDLKLVPKQVKGGVVLVGQTFTIKGGGLFGF